MRDGTECCVLHAACWKPLGMLLHWGAPRAAVAGSTQHSAPLHSVLDGHTVRRYM
jgi:hypothetical protein